MKKISIVLLIGAAIAASPLFLATAALAGQATTFSRTPQSDLVLQAINSLRAGHFDEFKSFLDKNALDLYGTPQGMSDLRDRFEHRAAGASTEIMNTRTELRGTVEPDTLLLLSHRAFSVDVLGTPSKTPGESPIWNVAVDCVGFIGFDTLGWTDHGCTIAKISVNGLSREPSSVSQNSGSVRDRNLDKQLRDDPAGSLGQSINSVRSGRAD